MYRLGILFLFLCGPPWIHAAAFTIPRSSPSSTSPLGMGATSPRPSDIRLQDLLHELNQRQIRYPPTATKQELWELLKSNSTRGVQELQEDEEDAISEEQLKQQIMQEIQSSIQMEKQVPDTERPRRSEMPPPVQEQERRPTIPQLLNQLDALGISYPRRGTRQQLQDLLLQHYAQTQAVESTTVRRRRRRKDSDEEEPILEDGRRRRRRQRPPPLGSRPRPRPQVRSLQSIWQSTASPQVQRISSRAIRLAQRQARQVYDWWMEEEEDENEDDIEVEEEPPRYVQAEPVSMNVPYQDDRATTTTTSRYTYYYDTEPFSKRRPVDQSRPRKHSKPRKPPPPSRRPPRQPAAAVEDPRPPPPAAAMNDQVSKQQRQRPIQDILQELRSRDISFSPTSTRADLEQALMSTTTPLNGGKVIIDVVAEPVVVPQANPRTTTPQPRRNSRSTSPNRQSRRDDPRTTTASSRQPRSTGTNNVPRLLPQRPQRRRPKKVYSMYNTQDDEDDDNDEILIKDAWEELGSRASDYVDRFLWGGEDEEQSDEKSTRRRPQTKRRKENEKDKDIPIQNQKKRHWKDRMEQSFDKALGIDPPPEGYRRWSEQDLREAQEQGRDAVSVAQGRAPKRRYYEKAPWQDSDSLLGMLFGPTEKKKRKRSKKSMNPFEERASRWDSEGSLSLLCKAIVRSIVPTVGAIAEWAGVRDTIPRPLVLAGVMAGILSSRPGKRLQNTLFLLLGIRLIAEFFHGYMYNDLDFAEDVEDDEEEDTEEDAATPKTNQDPYPA